MSPFRSFEFMKYVLVAIVTFVLSFFFFALPLKNDIIFDYCYRFMRPVTKVLYDQYGAKVFQNALPPENENLETHEPSLQDREELNKVLQTKRQ